MNISDYFQDLSYEIKALLFDWGNTVMKVFPEQAGPMISWPEVAAMPGIDQILPALKQQFKIILVSNAQHSNRAQVQAALDRINLIPYFDEIFTPLELNARKPAPDFFLNVLKQIKIEPQQAIMIGDDYENDIVAAKQVGLWTIWYNPDQKKLPGNGFPYHDVEVHHLPELATIIQPKMKF